MSMCDASLGTRDSCFVAVTRQAVDLPAITTPRALSGAMATAEGVAIAGLLRTDASTYSTT
jgi:hypothetical protein